MQVSISKRGIVVGSINTERFVKKSEGASAPHSHNVISLPLSPAKAKAMVLSHWNYLDRLSQRRFPLSENLAHEGLLFILEQLEKDDWHRIRTWQGLGNFSTYLTTLSARLLTDFQRKKCGHIRLPSWIRGKNDPAWLCAYQWLIVDNLSRQEATHRLQRSYPEKEAWFIGEIIRAVLARCDARPRHIEADFELDAAMECESPTLAPDAELEYTDEDLSAVLWQLLQDNTPPDSPAFHRIRDMISQLEPHLNLNQEDRLLLRLRFVDGLNMKKIAQHMQLKEDPYKRLHKILKGLRQSFQMAEMSS